MKKQYIINTIKSYLNDKINFTTCYNKIIDFYENQNFYINIEFLKDFLSSLYVKYTISNKKIDDDLKLFFEKILK